MAPPQSKKRRTAPAEPSSDSNSDSNSDADSSAGVALEDEFDLASSSSDDASKTGESSDSDSNPDGDSDISDILAAQTVPTKKRKRNNPAAFSETMSKILSSHLTTTARKDPVLVRAKKFQENIDDSKLEAKARRALKEERRRELEKGRVKDVVPRGDDEGARRALELEKRLRKTAQRGVVKLFNAVRAAQIKGEEEARRVKQKGVVGMGAREEKVTEMSKQGFLSLIQAGGKPK